MASAQNGGVLQIASDRRLFAVRHRADQADGFVPVIRVGNCRGDIASVPDCPGQALRFRQVVTAKGVLDEAELGQRGVFEGPGECRCVVG
jgi:hypothetical protein